MRKSVLAIIIASLVGILLLVYLITRFVDTGSVTTAQAQQACSELYVQAQAQVGAVEGYSIVGSDKSCKAEEDEMGSTDYLLRAEFSLAKSSTPDAALTNEDVRFVASKLPDTDRPWFVHNDPATDSFPETICISTSKYLNNDGEYIPQGSPAKNVKYYAPGATDYYASAACVKR